MTENDLVSTASDFSNGTAGAAGSVPPGAHARRFTRSEDFQTRAISIEIRDFAAPVFAQSADPARRTKTVSSKLIDLNETGLGVKALCPLAVGSTVDVSGELHSAECCVRLDARARVAHCRCQADGSFRVGLNFLDVKQQDLDCSHEPGFSLDGE